MKKLFIITAIAGAFALNSYFSSPEMDAKEFNDHQIKYEKMMEFQEVLIKVQESRK